MTNTTAFTWHSSSSEQSLTTHVTINSHAGDGSFQAIDFAGTDINNNKIHN